MGIGPLEFGKPLPLEEHQNNADIVVHEKVGEQTPFEKQRSFLKSISNEGSELKLLDQSVEIQDEDLYREDHKAEQADVSPSPLSSFLLSNIENLNEGELEKLKATFKNRAIVDIGAGKEAYGYMCAQALGASCYIAVEPFFSRGLLTALKRFPKSFSKIPWMIIDEDGLSAVKKMKDGGVNVLTVATDGLMLRDQEYNSELNAELARVIGNEGVFVGYDTVLFPREFKGRSVGSGSQKISIAQK